MRHCTAASRRARPVRRPRRPVRRRRPRLADRRARARHDRRRDPRCGGRARAPTGQAGRRRWHPRPSRGPMRPGTPRMLRGINDRAALDLLLEHGPLSRTRLGELTGLSKPTASQLLSRLEAADLVVASGSSRGGPGPRAQLYAVNPRAGHVAALDVTPARDAGRGRGHHRAHRRRARAPHAAATRTRRRVRRDVRPRRRRHRGRPRRQRTCTTSRSGHPVRSTRTRGACATPATCPAGTIPGLLDRLGDAAGVPVQVENDVNLAAVAELESGRARGVDDFVLLWVDEGLGAAIVIGGRLHGGVTGGAGEVGFLPLPGTPLVRDVRRGNAGAFQELAGGPAVLALARSLGIRATTAPAAVRTAHETPGAGDQLIATLGHRLAVGIAVAGRRPRPGPGRALRLRRPRRRRAPPGGGRRGARLARREPAAPGALRRTRGAGAHRRPPHRARHRSGRRLRHGPSSRQPGQRPARHQENTMIRHRLLRRRVAGTALTAALALALTACFGSSKGGANDNPNADVTITFWHGWSAPSEVAGDPGDHRRVREGQPEHPREGRRQHHRRQDQPGPARRRVHRRRTWCRRSRPTTSASSAPPTRSST